MIISIYKSYGVLAHEKEPVYTYGNPASEIYDVASVEIPEAFKPREAVHIASDTILVHVGGYDYLINEVLTNAGDAPALRWSDGDKTHWRRLRIVKA